MTGPGSAAGPSSAGQGKGGWLRLQLRAVAGAAQDRFEGSSGQRFLRQLGDLDFVDSNMLFGAALLIAVLPFVILLSSLANHRIDTDLSRHIGLNHEGALIVSHLFRSSPAHPAAAMATALVLAVAGTMSVANSLQVIYERSSANAIAAGETCCVSPPGLVSCSGSWSQTAVVVLGAVAGATWDQHKGRSRGVRA